MGTRTFITIFRKDVSMRSRLDVVDFDSITIFLTSSFDVGSIWANGAGAEVGSSSEGIGTEIGEWSFSTRIQTLSNFLNFLSKEIINSVGKILGRFRIWQASVWSFIQKCIHNFKKWLSIRAFLDFWRTIFQVYLPSLFSHWIFPYEHIILFCARCFQLFFFLSSLQLFSRVYHGAFGSYIYTSVGINLW